MKPVILATALVATNAMAIDFDTEWAKFQPQFERLRGVKVAKLETREQSLAPVEVRLPSMPSKENTLEQVDPKAPERLGHKLSDPAMREKVTGLYKKPDTVVYSLTLTE